MYKGLVCWVGPKGLESAIATSMGKRWRRKGKGVSGGDGRRSRGRGKKFQSIIRLEHHCSMICLGRSGTNDSKILIKREEPPTPSRTSKSIRIMRKARRSLDDQALNCCSITFHVFPLAEHFESALGVEGTLLRCLRH